MEEEVLVVPAQRLATVGNFTGFFPGTSDYLEQLLDPQHLRFLPRSAAEQDPSYKQLIPYIVLRSNDMIYTYARGKKGGETRLHDQLSIGIGGHINREDGGEGRDAYDAGYRRELDEEVEIRSSYQGNIVGLLYDPSTPVGEVHVGVVHLLDLGQPEVVARDPALAEARFQSLDALAKLRERMETWSALVMDRVLLSSSSSIAEATRR